MAFAYKQEQEIKRLRGLLREAFDGLDGHWVTTPGGVSWVLRANEVLDDEQH
jgi:hypothetical protein